MEQKAMGEFIAALRKANGLTQKQLAEKLGVSDKSVSRWERGDGAPDLALIPVIAEVFGVSCDELLRGERRPPDAEAGAAPAGPDPKAEKQRAWLLRSTLYRFRSKSIAAIALAVAGVCVAAGIDLGLCKAAIALCVGAVVLLMAALVEAVAVNSALLAVAGEEPAQTGELRAAVVRWAERVFTFILALLAFLLPLLRAGTYGLALSYWLLYGLPAALATGMVCAAVCVFLNAHFVKTGTLPLPSAGAEAARANARLLRRCLLGLGCAAALTLAAHAACTSFWDSSALAPSTAFDDWDSFVDYMETETPAQTPAGTADGRAEPVQPPEPDRQVWLDTNGEPTAYDDWMGYTVQEITDADGNVLCRFVHRNLAAVSWRYSSQNGVPVLPVRVRTNADCRAREQRLRRYNTVFAAFYAAEALAAGAVYLARRKKVKM